MVKSFTTITEDNIIDAWESFLEIQAELCAKKDVDYMFRLGLSDSGQSILDFGCGIGAYATQLRKHLPKSKIIATDINKELLDKFRKRLNANPDNNIEILKWDSMKDTTPQSVKECKLCIIRLVLQHVPDPEAVLISLKNALQKGTRVFVIEEDDGFFQVYPEFAAFDKILNTWKNYGAKYVNTRHMGRRLPYLLSKAGFNVTHVEVIAHTNIDWGLDNMIAFLISTLRLIHASDPNSISPDEIREVEKAFSDYKKKYQNNCSIIFPQILTVGEVV